MKKEGFRSGLRFGLMAVFVCMLVLGAVKFCNVLLVDDSKSYTRLTLHDFYEDERNIEVLFLGSSHCFRAYDPMLFEELTGKHAFNLGSSSQNYDTSYYLLREAARKNKLETVYLDLYYKFLFMDNEERDLVQANIISDYMEPSLNKLAFLTETMDGKQLTNRLFPFRRNWQKLADIPYLKETAGKKQEASYRNFEPVRVDAEYYAGQGFVRSEAVLDAESITWWDNFSKIEEDMKLETETALSYIEKIAEFCREEGIRLVFVTAPSFSKYLEIVGPYEPVQEFQQELAENYGVTYLDFNLYGEEVLPLGEDCFIDVDHLNGEGARRVTELLAAEEAQMYGGFIDEYFKP